MPATTEAAEDLEHLSMSTFLSLYLSLSLSVSLYLSPSIYLSIYLSIHAVQGAWLKMGPVRQGCIDPDHLAPAR